MEQGKGYEKNPLNLCVRVCACGCVGVGVGVGVYVYVWVVGGGWLSSVAAYCCEVVELQLQYTCFERHQTTLTCKVPSGLSLASFPL